MHKDPLDDKIIGELTACLGPRLLLDVIRSLADEELSNWEISRTYQVSLYSISLLRARPLCALRYVLKQLPGRGQAAILRFRTSTAPQSLAREQK
jgi:hypothetical protein